MAELEQVSDTQTEEPAKEPFNLKKELWEWAKAIFFAAVIVFIVFHFIIQVVTVKGSSMEPTLENQDRLVISNLFYTPETGDIVVLSDKTGLDEALIKRIIALPGQTVDINENGEVLVDGEPVSRLRGRKLREMRHKIGMIFQNYNLVYSLSVLQNVLHGRLGYMSGPRGIFGLYSEEDKQAALDLLEEMGMEQFASPTPFGPQSAHSPVRLC